MRRSRRRFIAVVGTTIAILYLYAGFTLAATLLPRDDPTITIGAKGFTEQYVLAEVLGQWVERETGYPTNQMQSLGSMVAFDAMVAGDIDVLVDYTGTLWANVLKRTTAGINRDVVLAEVSAFLFDRHGIQVVATLGFENAYAVAARAQDAERMRLTRISDLTPFAPTLSMAGDFEFFSRPEWVAIRDAYELTFDAQRTMDAGLMYQAVAEGAVDLISAYTTDGRITAYDLRVLEDDRGAIPPYDAVVLVSAELSRKRPDVVSTLSQLQDTIDVATMRRMNLLVDEQGVDPVTVAAGFITTLSADRPRSDGARTRE